MLKESHKKWLDSHFNKEAMKTYTKEKFLKLYAGKMPIGLDIGLAADYLGVKKTVVKAKPEK